MNIYYNYNSDFSCFRKLIQKLQITIKCYVNNTLVKTTDVRYKDISCV